MGATKFHLVIADGINIDINTIDINATINIDLFKTKYRDPN